MNSPVTPPAGTEEELKPEVLSFFSSKKVLIIDPQKSLRSTFKRVLKDIGVPLNSIEFSEGDIQHAKESISEIKPELIFCPMSVQNISALDFYQLQRESIANALGTGFFIVSPQNSVMNATFILDNELDGCITEPFTAAGIKKTILAAVERKLVPTEFLERYETLRARIRTEDATLTIEEIEQLDTLPDAKEDKISYLKGLFFFQRHQYQEALEYLEDAHAYDPKAYQPMKKLAETYMQLKIWNKAYEVRQRMLENYPLNPETIPELIKLSVVNEKFDDIFHYLKIFEGLEEKSPQTEKYIAAGLTLCGKFLLQKGEKDRAVNALQKATKLSQGQLEVVKTASSLLLEHGFFLASKEIIDEYRDQYSDNPEFQIVELQILGQSPKTVPVALKSGLNLIAKGHKTPLVYENVIRLAVKMKRNPEFIDDLIFDACKLYPDQAQLFKSLNS